MTDPYVPQDDYEKGCVDATHAFNRWLNSIPHNIPAVDTSLRILRPLLEAHRMEKDKKP